MFIVKTILKGIGKILLIPVWLLLAIAWIFVKLCIEAYCLVGGLAYALITFVFIGTVIWFRTDVMKYAFIAVCAGMVTGIMFLGVSIQTFLEFIMGEIGDFILP